MHHGQSGYDALMAVHRARIDSARTSAVAAGLGHKPKRTHRSIRSLVRMRRRGLVRADHNAETLFFA